MSTPHGAHDRSNERNQQERAGSLISQYLMALGEEVGAVELEPEALVRAAVRVLPVDGAGLSMMVGILRQPLAATSEDCRFCEELQSTLGDGPCLLAVEAHEALVADLPEIERCWPQYAAELAERTSFRSVAAAPLRAAPGETAFAALDLYSTSPQFSDELDEGEVAIVGELIGALLATCVAKIGELDSVDAGPEWFRSVARRRHDVWVAIGMVRAREQLSPCDALSLLRGHAYSQSRGLDDLAADVVGGKLSLTALTGDLPASD